MNWMNWPVMIKGSEVECVTSVGGKTHTYINQHVFVVNQVSGGVRPL